MKGLRNLPEDKKSIEEVYKYKDLVRPTYSSLIIQSEGMEPRKYDSLLKAASHIGVSRQTLAYTHMHKKPLIIRRKGGVKAFFIEWLEDQYSTNHNLK